MYSLDNLLDAPCILCGYNGEGYWQPGTHNAGCLFENIGDINDRTDALFKALRAGEFIIRPKDNRCVCCGATEEDAGVSLMKAGNVLVCDWCAKYAEEAVYGV